MGGIDTGEYVVLFLIVFLLICGQWSCDAQPDYTTRHGIQVYDQTETRGTDRADIEYITAVALELWPTDLGRAVLRLRDEPIDLSLYYVGECGDEVPGTFAEGTMTVWIAQDPCFARTTYGHELLHLLYWTHHGWKYGTHEELRELNRELRRRTIGGMCNDD